MLAPTTSAGFRRARTYEQTQFFFWFLPYLIVLNFSLVGILLIFFPLYVSIVVQCYGNRFGAVFVRECLRHPRTHRNILT